jgi:hypothetical protein
MYVIDFAHGSKTIDDRRSTSATGPSACIRGRPSTSRASLARVIVAHTMAFSLSTTQKLGCTRVRAQRAPVKRNAVKRAVVPRAASASADVPDMTKRSVMNLLLVGAIGLPATSLIGGYAYFFVPPRCAQRRARVAIATSAIAIRSREMAQR